MEQQIKNASAALQEWQDDFSMASAGKMERALDELIKAAAKSTPVDRLTLVMVRDVEAKEISGLVWGSGSMSWPWWSSARAYREGHLVEEPWDNLAFGDTIRIVHDRPDGEEGAFDGVTNLTLHQILDAASRALRGDGCFIDAESARDMAKEDLGYADALAGDAVLQLAVFNEVVFG